jgi:hypothetical protein
MAQDRNLLRVSKCSGAAKRLAIEHLSTLERASEDELHDKNAIAATNGSRDVSGASPDARILEPPWASFRLRRSIHAALFFLPLLYFLLNLALERALHERYRDWFASEDGVWEDLQALAYAAAVVCALLLGRRFLAAKMRAHAAFQLAFALAMLLCLLEEISWGQRLLDYAPPAWIASHNFQGETNLHNLKAVQPLHVAIVLAISVGAGLAWRVLPARWLRTRGAPLASVLPGPQTMLYFAAPALFGLALRYQSLVGVRWLRIGHQELFETTFALGFLVTAAWNLRHARVASAQRA